METRHTATPEEVQAIATLVRRGEPVGHLVGRVILNDSQRSVIQAAHADRLSFRVYEVPEKLVYIAEGAGYFHCWQGGAPGLVQQRIRRF